MALAAVHAPTAGQARVLDRDAALALVDEDDEDVTIQIAEQGTGSCCRSSSGAGITARGSTASVAMMPAMMISEAPLPTPYSVISSPIHITSNAPAMSDVITTIIVPTGLSCMSATVDRPLLQEDARTR